MASFDESAFLDLLYGAAVEPELWIAVMERLTDRVGGNSAFLSQLDFTTGKGTGLIARIDPSMPSLYLTHYTDLNVFSKVPNATDYAKSWAPRILTDEDWIPKEELVGTEYYNDFLRPQDVHSLLMIRLTISAPTVSVLNIHRGRSDEQFGAAERNAVARLHPHLIRAFKLSEKLAANRQLDQAAEPLFETSSHGLFLVDGLGRVLRVNRAGESLTRAGVGLAVVRGRLSSDAPAAARRLEALMAAAATPDVARRTGGSMSIASERRRLPLGVTVSPVRPERTTFLAPAAHALVCVTDLQADVVLPGDRLGDLFGLTPAEVRVALALVEGITAKEAADRLGVSPHTIHIHVTRIFEKVGVRRQSELVSVIMRAVNAPPA